MIYSRDTPFWSGTLEYIYIYIMCVCGCACVDVRVCVCLLECLGKLRDWFDVCCLRIRSLTSFLLLLLSAVQCEPGYFFNGGACTECGDGQYQDLAGQTQCKMCGNGATFSTQPRLSADQCVGRSWFHYHVMSSPGLRDSVSSTRRMSVLDRIWMFFWHIS